MKAVRDVGLAGLSSLARRLEFGQGVFQLSGHVGDRIGKVVTGRRKAITGKA